MKYLIVYGGWHGIKFENEIFTKKLVDNELHKSAAKQIWYIQALSFLLDSDEGLIRYSPPIFIKAANLHQLNTSHLGLYKERLAIGF